MPEEQQEEFQEVESSGSTNTLLIALLAAIVGVGVGFGVMFFMNSGSAGESSDGGEMRGGTETAGQLPDEVSEKLHRQATFYISLGSFEVNLKDDYYLSAEVQLKAIDYQRLHELEQSYTSNQTEQALYRPPARARAVPAVSGGGGGGDGGGNGEGSGSATPEIQKIIEKRQPEMRSLMIDVFNSTPSRELRDPDGKDRIRQNIKQSLNDMIRDDKGKILEVLFSKFVLAPVS